MPDLQKIPAFQADQQTLNVIIETPQGSRCKMKFSPEHGLFELWKVLPAGYVFPFPFGFVPSTKAEDGDPLDVMVLMDAPVPMGTLVASRLIGALEAEQTVEGKTERNDRLIAVPVAAEVHEGVRNLEDLPPKLLEELESFFEAYTQANGKDFRVIGRTTAEGAMKLVREAVDSQP